MEHFGKYQLVRKLATGGMAEVFIAKFAGALGFEKTVVLKRILPHLAENPHFIQMFLSEAKIVARLSHPNVVQVFDFGDQDGEYYLVMELVDGPTLRDVCKQMIDRDRRLPLEFCAEAISQACEGLAYAHDFCDPESGQWMGIIHRDVSPENILISGSGCVKVVDFGIAKAVAISTTKSHSLRGKYGYMAPEQLRRKTPLDRRVDVYALGIVLYELMTGEKPWNASSEMALMRAILSGEIVPASKRRPDVPKLLDHVLGRALGRRDHRYPDCREMQADLQSFLTESGSASGPSQLTRVLDELTATGAEPRSRPGTQRTRAEFEAGSVTNTRVMAPRLALQLTPSDEQNPEAMTLALAQRPDEPKPQRPRSAPEPTVGVRLGTTAFGAAVGVIAISVVGFSLLRASQPPAAAVRPPPPAVLAPTRTPRSSVMLLCDPPGEVFFRGADVGWCPVKLTDVEPGEASIRVSDSALGFSKSVVLTLAPGDNGAQTVSAEHVSVDIQVKAGTRVTVDGRMLGTSPVGSVRLFEGAHQFHLGYVRPRKDVDVDFVVEPGHPNVFRHEL